MQKKLTLSIDEELVRFAHEFSRKTRQSISNMIALYLHDLKTHSEASPLAEKTLSLYGFFSDKPVPSKKELRKQFHENESKPHHYQGYV